MQPFQSCALPSKDIAGPSPSTDPTCICANRGYRLGLARPFPRAYCPTILPQKISQSGLVSRGIAAAVALPTAWEFRGKLLLPSILSLASVEPGQLDPDLPLASPSSPTPTLDSRPAAGAYSAAGAERRLLCQSRWGRRRCRGRSLAVGSGQGAVPGGTDKPQHRSSGQG